MPRHSGQPARDRRSLLKRLGAVAALGAGSGTVTTGRVHGDPPAPADYQSDRRLSLTAPTDTPVSYTFSVTGTVEKSTHVPPDAPHDTATRDGDDEVHDGTVEGATAGGVDSYLFTGELTAFDLSDCTAATVWLDDRRVDACELTARYPGGGGSDPTGIDTCTTITEAGAYVLRDDIAVGAADACLEITADDVTLDGQGHNLVDESRTSDTAGIRVAGSDVTVRTLTVENCRPCAVVRGDAVTLRDCELRNPGRGTGTGVRLTACTDCTLAGTTISASTVGATLDGAGATTVRNCRVGTVGDEAVRLERAENSLFTASVLRGTTFGLVADGAHGTVVTDCEVTGDNEPALSFTDTDRTGLWENTVRGSWAGLVVDGGRGWLVDANTVTDAHGPGILLDGVTGARIVGNTVRNNAPSPDDGAVDLRATADCDVVDNVLCENGPGEWIVVDEASTGTVVRGNERC